MIMWAEAALLVMFFLGYLVGRHNRNNDVHLCRSVDSAIIWISKNCRSSEEQKKMVDFLIWLEDGEEEGQED